MNMKTAFTARLQTALTATGTSREKLAAHLGVSFSTIRRWLNGVCAPDVYQFREIARFFGVSYHYNEQMQRFGKCAIVLAVMKDAVKRERI